MTRRRESEKSNPDFFGNNIIVTQASPKLPTNEKLSEMGEKAKGEKVSKPGRPARKLAAKTLKQSNKHLNLERNSYTYVES